MCPISHVIYYKYNLYNFQRNMQMRTKTNSKNYRNRTYMARMIIFCQGLCPLGRLVWQTFRTPVIGRGRRVKGTHWGGTQCHPLEARSIIYSRRRTLPVHLNCQLRGITWLPIVKEYILVAQGKTDFLFQKIVFYNIKIDLLENICFFTDLITIK